MDLAEEPDRGLGLNICAVAGSMSSTFAGAVMTGFATASPATWTCGTTVSTGLSSFTPKTAATLAKALAITVEDGEAEGCVIVLLGDVVDAWASEEDIADSGVEEIAVEGPGEIKPLSESFLKAGLSRSGVLGCVETFSVCALEIIGDVLNSGFPMLGKSWDEVFSACEKEPLFDAEGEGDGADGVILKPGLPMPVNETLFNNDGSCI